MTETKKYIKKISVSTFKGTICLSEGEFERHLSTFAYQRALKFLKWDDGKLAEKTQTPFNYDDIWNEFLKDEEHERETK